MLTRRDVDLAKTAPLLAMVGDVRTLLPLPAADDDIDTLRHHQRTGRPLRRRKPGPKPRTERKQS